MTDTLPPLPHPDTHCWDEDERRDVWSHSAEQVREYAAQAIAAAVAKERERCAGLCDEDAARRHAEAVPLVSKSLEVALAWLAGTNAAKACAAAIRGDSSGEIAA